VAWAVRRNFLDGRGFQPTASLDGRDHDRGEPNEKGHKPRALQVHGRRGPLLSARRGLYDSRSTCMTTRVKRTFLFENPGQKSVREEAHASSLPAHRGNGCSHYS